MFRPSIEKSRNEMLVSQQHNQVFLLMILTQALRFHQKVIDNLL
jgi:hypothetical protein